MDLIGSAKLREIVINELTRIGGILKRDEIHILCCFHSDMNPSLGVHVGHKVPPGTFHCFSCGASGGWNKLARQLNLVNPNQNLRQVDYQETSKITQYDDPFLILSKEMKNSVILEEKEVPTLTGIEPLPPNFSWRGIPREFYEKLGAKFYWESKPKIDFEMDWLYIPLYTNSRYVGYTLCALKPNKPKYKTFTDASKHFFLYDLLKEGETVVVVEGHFDALRLANFGIPAVAIFGVENWSPVKKALLLAKNPAKVLILMDGDEAGHKAAKEVFADIENLVETENLEIPITPEKLDPGNMPLSYIEAIRGKLGLS